MTDQRPQLTIVRRYAAPVAKVYAAWLEPAQLKRWFAPSDAMSVPIAEVDPRVGGAYRLRMQNADGDTYTVSGVYRELTIDRRLEFTWQWEGSETEMLIRVELAQKGGQTELTLTQSGFASSEAKDQHSEGWDGCLKRLGNHLETAPLAARA